MNNHVRFAAIALVAALPLLAAVPAAVRETDSEERLSAAVRALPAEQRSKLRVGRPVAVAQEQQVSAVMRPGALVAVRRQHLVPHERTAADPAITLHYVRKIDAICTVLPADTRRAAGLDDAVCVAVKERLASPAR